MPTIAQTRTAKDKVAAKRSANKDKWTLIFVGLYAKMEGSQIVQKPYRVTIIVPDRLIFRGVHHLFVKYYAPKVMPNLYSGYQHLFTFDVESATCSDPDKERTTVSVLSREQLVAYIVENDLPVEQELYPDPADLRQAINECTDPKSEKGFLQNQVIRRERLGDTLVVAADTLDFIEESLLQNEPRRKKIKQVADPNHVPDEEF